MKWRYELTESANTCSKIQINHHSVYVWGLVILKTETGYYDRLDYIVNRIINKEVDFNNLHGFFKILIDNQDEGSFTLLTDNSGSQIFYLDSRDYRISDSLLLLSKGRKDNKPNYESCSRFLRESRVFSDDTVISDISVTNKDYVYTVTDGGVKRKEKHLTPFYKKTDRINLKQYMEAILANISIDRVKTVLTGGTDNRAIIAHMSRMNKLSSFILSGRSSNPDVTVAKRIANQLNEPIEIYDPDDKTDNWIKEGFEFSDGIYDTVLSYRHYRLMSMACQGGAVRYVIGGVGGEFYKNDFCKFIRRRYMMRKINAERLSKDIFSTMVSPPEWFSVVLCEAMKKEGEYITTRLKSIEKGCLLCKCNSAGFWKLTKSMSTVTNNYARYCTKIDPLMDRDIIAGASNDSALRHCMYYWQRREVTNNNKILARMKTDQGLTCSTNILLLVIDWIKVMFNYARQVKYKLIRGKVPEFDYWDKDYIQASDTEEYKQAVEVCYDIGLLADRNPEAIPLKYRGRILTLGMLFDE